MIFLFSGTGNTRWAASVVAQACGERIVDIATEPDGPLCYTLSEGERVGFCFPVHGWQPPAIVRRFVARLTLANAKGHYCFALCTCGDSVGEAIGMFRGHLRKRGIMLNSAFSLLMPDTYVCLPFMDVDGQEEMSGKLKTARSEVQTIANDVANRRSGVERLHKGYCATLLTYFIGVYFNRRMITDRPFRVDATKCVSCGLCASVCPTDNIAKADDGSPQWLGMGRCTCCLACYHHCPQQAISYGRHTKGKGQYYFKGEK